MELNAENELKPEAIRRSLGDYGIDASETQISQIQKYILLLLAWNQKVNITAIQDPREILFRHFCESMYVVPLAEISRGRLADVGSGGGFPGLPIKILVPGLEVLLVESNMKKAAFLAEVVRELGLEAVRVLVGRYEELDEEVAPVDYVCSRALGDYEKLLGWAASSTLAARSVMLWIGAGDVDKVKAVSGWGWREAVPIPHSLRRFLLIGDRRE